MSEPADRPPSVAVPVDTVDAFIGDPALLASGRPGGPLAGLTLAVKDLFDIAGVVTGAGNPTYAATHRAAESTARAVTQLVAGGASVVGKTITDELAYSLSGTNIHYGTPRNVAAPGRIPGGSSAGSAAAVAAGLVDFALGTDTAGSIRVPASYCGIVGWRPTHGAISLDGVVPLAPSFDTAGLLARDPAVVLAGARILLDNGAPLAGSALPGNGAPTDSTWVTDRPGGPIATTPSYVERVRFAVIAETLMDSSPAVADAVSRIAIECGSPSVPLVLGVDLDDTLMAFRMRQGWEAWQAHGEWIRSTAGIGGPKFGPGIASRFEAASHITLADVAVADRIRSTVRSILDEATAGDTILVMPAAAGAAPGAPADRQAHEMQRMRTLRLTSIAGLAGLPVVVLPIAEVEGLPLGVAFVGARGSDLQLISAVSSMASFLAGRVTE